MKKQKNIHRSSQTISILLIGLIIFFSQNAFAHGGHKHEERSSTNEKMENPSNALHSDNPLVKENTNDSKEKTMAPFSAFPNLHPLVVHFPIVLLLLAFAFQIVSFFAFQKAFSWATIFLLLFGFIGAWIASEYAHPHTTGLSDHAYRVLVEHERYASITLWSSGIALLLKIVSYRYLKLNKWTEILVALLLLISATAVSLAGHHGAQLVHIEGIGPKGNYLETGSHEH